MGRLAGKVAIVSGCAEGIGAATARRLAAEGATVVAADIALAGAERVAEGIRASGGNSTAKHVDLADEEAITALISSVVEEFGSLHVLHNNAADTRVEQMQHDMALTDMTSETWDRAFLINARGTMLMVKHAVPAMIASGGGSIVNTSSGAALRGDLFSPAYAASKAAVINLTMYAATQYGKQGIRANAVVPGLVLTPALTAVVPPEQIHRIEVHTLTPYLGLPDDLAACVAFLASDDARYVTGQVLVADGGYTAHMPHTGEVAAAFSADPSQRNGAVDDGRVNTGSDR